MFKFFKEEVNYNNVTNNTPYKLPPAVQDEIDEKVFRYSNYLHNDPEYHMHLGFMLVHYVNNFRENLEEQARHQIERNMEIIHQRGNITWQP